VEVQGVGRDVTQLKLAENEALQRREQVMHLTRVAILGELSGALAHELNQPLTAILMNVESAQRLLGMEQIDLAEIRSILADVANDDRRASDVIARLRALLKRGELKVESLDVNSLVTEVLALTRGQLIERRVSVVTKLAAALPAARGDRVQLQQVLLNLLVNACDSVSANDEADRSLTIATASGNDGYVRVSVADNGVAIPSEATELVFEPFFTTKQDGLGLGLSICRSIVVAHGGRLAGTNNLDRGATFTFTLPAQHAATGA
jgi:C4-dicarboxylate-specific signal transduction histidine kinase